MRHLWLLLGACVCLIVLMVLLITLVVVPTSPFNGDILSGDGNVAVVTEALQMAEHLHCFPNPCLL